jgi:hypothetical protein
LYYLFDRSAITDKQQCKDNFNYFIV